MVIIPPIVSVILFASIFVGRTVWADPISKTVKGQSLLGSSQLMDTAVSITDEQFKAADHLPVAGAGQILTSQLLNYTVKSGDTLSGIAGNFNLRVSTLQSANKLKGDLLSVGQRLLILPDDGLLIKTSSNTTLPDIVKKFSITVEQLMVDNGLETPEDVPELIFCYRCSNTSAVLRPSAVSKVVAVATTQSVAPTNSEVELSAIEAGDWVDLEDAHEFPVGFCTYYVAKKVKITFGGNAVHWLSNAKAAGYATGDIPAAGAIVSMHGVGRYAKYGHVAFVERVEGENIIVSEMNYTGWNQISSRSIPVSSLDIRGYIYPIR